MRAIHPSVGKDRSDVRERTSRNDDGAAERTAGSSELSSPKDAVRDAASRPRKSQKARRPRLAAGAVGTAPMEAKLVDDLPSEPGWQFEPKWDGFRCLAFRAGDEVDLRAKSGKPLGALLPRGRGDAARACAATRFVLDGELAIPVGDTLSFDALQMRLHPAESRIRKLVGRDARRS